MTKKRKTDLPDIVKLENSDKKIKNESEKIDTSLDLSITDSCNKNIEFDNKLEFIDNTTAKIITTNTSRLSLKSKLRNKDQLKLAPIFDNNPFIKNKVDFTNERINEVEFAPKLENLGNSCYLNVVVNVLFGTPIFVRNVNELNFNINETITQMSALSSLNNSAFQYPDPLPKSWKLIRNLNELFNKMGKCLMEKMTPIKPNDLLNTLNQLNENFILNQQQDAHELLRFILETLQESIFELNTIRSINESFIKTSLKNYINKMQKDINDKKIANKQAKKINGEKNGICYRNENTAKNIEEQPSVLESKKSLISGFFKKNKPTTQDILNSVNCNHLANVAYNSFIGSVSNSIRCLECETVSSTTQEFLDYGVDVAQKNKLFNSMLADSDDEDGKNQPFRRVSAKDWIDINLQDVEIIGKENKFFCSICNQYVEAEKCSRIIHNPQIFIVNLKRFVSFSSFSGCYTKCLDYFDIPLTMNCVQHNCSDITHRYELFAIISHMGFTITSGHYTAFVKTRNFQKNLENIIKKPTLAENNLIEEKEIKLIENCDIINKSTEVIAVLNIANNTNLTDNNANLTDNNTYLTDNNTSLTDNNTNLTDTQINVNINESNFHKKNVITENKINIIGENKLKETYNLINNNNSTNTFDTEMDINLKELNNDSWWFYDDDKVSLLSSHELSIQLAKKSSDTPYLLFYQMI